MRGMNFAFLRKIRSLLLGEELYPEAAAAYFHRLPDRVDVQWFRDGNYIIGRIETGGDACMTQAISAREFVEMVNDSVFAAYGIPVEYFDVLRSKRFIPTRDEFEKLNDAAIRKSTLRLEKGNLVA